MSKKVSAFQVYSEDQTHQRHARSYRPAPGSRSQSQGGKYLSPPSRSTRTSSMDWRDDVKMDSYGQVRRSTSPEVRQERSYNYDAYDSRRQESGALRDSRYGEDVRQNNGRDRQNMQSRYDDQYDRRSWEREDRRDDYTTNASRDRGSHVHKDNYTVNVDTQRPVSAKAVPNSAHYTDSDEECLHENLRRKKQKTEQFRVEEDDRRWSTDDDYSDYRQMRKRALSGAAYHSPSPPPVSDWRDDTARRFSPQQERQRPRTYFPRL